MSKKIPFLICFFFLVMFSKTLAQVFTFECVCKNLVGDTCDICPVNGAIQSRSFQGLIIRRNGVITRWIDEPYTIRKFSNESIEFLELIPNPDKITIARFQTIYTTMNDFVNATNCFCGGGERQIYIHSGTSTYTNTLSDGGGSWSLTGAGIAVVSRSGSAVTVTATEVDGSVTNEGQIGVGAGSGTSSVITSNSSGASGVTINAAGILSITETTSTNGGSITITGTEVDGSVTNELQSISYSAPNLTLSSGGGSVAININASQILQSSATTGQVLKWNGTAWVASTDASGVAIPNLEITYGSGASVQSNSAFTYSTQGRINLNGIIVGRPNGISAGVSFGTGVGYLNTEGANVLIGDSCAPQMRASRYNTIIGPYAARNLRGPGSAFADSRSNFAAIGGYNAFGAKWSFDAAVWGYNGYGGCDSCNFVAGLGYSVAANVRFAVYSAHLGWGNATNTDTLLSTASLGAESMRYRNRAEEDTWLGAKSGEGLSTSRTYGNNGTGFLVAPVIRFGKRNDISGWRSAPNLRDGEWNTFHGPYTAIGCTDCVGNTVIGGQITIASDAYRQVLIGDSFGGVKFWNTGSNTILYDYLTFDYYKLSTTPAGTAVKNLSVTSTGVVVLTDISSGGSTVAEPLNQIVIGTGTGLDSDAGFTYDPTTNLLTTNGDMIIGDGVNGKITLANNDPIVQIDANYTYYKAPNNEPGIQIGKAGSDNSIYISRNNHFHRNSAGAIISTLKTGEGMSINNGSSVRAALDVNGFGNTSSTWTAQFHNSDANNDALMIRNDGRIGFGTQSMIGKYNFNGTVRIAIQGSTATSIAAYDDNLILTSLTIGSGLALSGGTLSATAGDGTTNLSFTGTSSPVTLNSSTGTDVTFTAGTGITLSATSTDITINSTTITEPSNQIVYGTGTGLDSDAGFTYDPTTNLLTTNGDMIIGDGVNGKITLANNDPIVQIDANYTYYKAPNNEPGIQIGKAGSDNSIYISRNNHFHRNSAGAIISTLKTGEGMSINNGSSVRAALDVNGFGNTSSTWTAQFHNSDANNDALMIRNDGRIGFGTQSMVAKYNFNGTTRIMIQGSTATSIAAYDDNLILTSLTIGSGLTLSAGTLSATAGAGTTNLSFTGTSSPVTLNSSTGTDVTFTAGTGITLSATGTNVTITGNAPGVTGSGTTNIIPKFTSSTAIGDSQISDNGTTVGIGTTTGTGKMAVWGAGTTSSTWTAQFHNSAGNNNALRIRDDGRIAIGTGTAIDANFNLFGSFHQRRSSGSFGDFMVNEANATGLEGMWNFFTNADISPDGFGKFGFRFQDGSNGAARQFQVYVGDLGTPRMIISGTGMGLGTVAPEARLHSRGSTSDTGGFIALFQNSSGQNGLALRNDLRLQFEGLSGTGTRLMELGSSGIATRSSIDPATIATTANAFIQFGNSFAAAATIGTNDANQLNFETNATIRATITNDGRFVIGTSTAATNTALTIYTASTTNAPAIVARPFESGAGTAKYAIFETPGGVERGSIEYNSDFIFRSVGVVNLQAGTRSFTVYTNGAVSLPNLSSDPTVAEGHIFFNNTDKRLRILLSSVANNVATVEKDFIGLTAASYVASITLPADQLFSVANANAGSFTITLGSLLREGITYVIECRQNGTNTITFAVESGYNLAADKITTFPNDAPLVCGNTGTGIQAPSSVYVIRRFGTIITIK